MLWPPRAQSRLHLWTPGWAPLTLLANQAPWETETITETNWTSWEREWFPQTYHHYNHFPQAKLHNTYSCFFADSPNVFWQLFRVWWSESWSQSPHGLSLSPLAHGLAMLFSELLLGHEGRLGLSPDCPAALWQQASCFTLYNSFVLFFQWLSLKCLT